jgi:uracil-DNA glycosylase
VVVTLGNVATRALLDTDKEISDIHKECSIERSHHHPDIPLIDIFYGDGAEKAIEEDIRSVAKTAGLLE